VNESTAGGAATNVGVSFQNRVAVWICVRILTGRDVAPLWGLPAETALDFLRCETEQPVDDILVGTSKRGNVFIQVKHTVRLERDAASGIGSAIHQFVRQFVTSGGVGRGKEVEFVFSRAAVPSPARVGISSADLSWAHRASPIPPPSSPPLLE
jgi:hypothetical protein